MSVKNQILLILVFVMGFPIGCQKKKDHDLPLNTKALAVYEDENAEYPRLTFPDGSVSLNDRCPVRRVKLNRRMPPLYVNGRPVGFC